MIPAKEAKDMLYTLLSENLVQLQVTHKYTHTLYKPYIIMLTCVFPP